MTSLNSHMSGLEALGEAELLAAEGQRAFAASVARLAAAALRRLQAWAWRPSAANRRP